MKPPGDMFPAVLFLIGIILLLVGVWMAYGAAEGVTAAGLACAATALLITDRVL
jgi:hypothetical protein